MSLNKDNPISLTFTVNIVNTCINFILDGINEKRDQPVKRATLQVQLRRLEGKGWLKKEQKERAYLFSASQKEQTSFLTIALDAKERLFDGDCSKFVRCLFENDKLSGDEIADLKRLLNEAENNNDE